ncbi:hypothetical protein Ahy_B01g054200 isoform A [Arachis hypogaea]|uniref:Uncharacterized protein n=1 Tax=Arachis hypogaea TaxID=3818 RepID=A0A445ATH2_ARAHY|nr:hypothetical protein Ahy_B01g054200 isoform A [Arachis hypogaea]
METKLQERMEAMKSQMLCGFNMFLNQLQKSLPGVDIPNLSFMSTTLYEKEVEATTTTHHEVTTATEKEVRSIWSHVYLSLDKVLSKSKSASRNILESSTITEVRILVLTLYSSSNQEIFDLKLEKKKHDQHKKRLKKKKVVC